MSLPDEACPACGAEVFDIDVTCSSCGHALSSTGAQRLIGARVLGQYEITGILGQGGMSVVYRGKHAVTGQEVALKVLPPDLAAYKDVKDRFLEEGRALAQLDHPNIVHLYNFGSDGDSLVLAMQFVRGKTWERVIMEEGRIPWKRSAELTCDVARALAYAHGRGIIHRDMKPSNVLIRELDGAATVMDFGIAKMQSSTKLTATGQTMGTVRYMSPEQVRGKVVDERTDIYSLAMTTYESVVGDTPFTGDTHFEIMTKHLNEMPVPPSERGVSVPPVFEAVLMRAISKAPEDRQASAKEFTEQLEAALQGKGGSVSSGGRADSLSETLPMGSSKSDGRPPLKAQASALGSTRASSSAAKEFEDTLPTNGRRGLFVGLALTVLAAGAATYLLTRGDKSETAESGAAPPPQVLEDAAPKSIATILSEAFVLPGTKFAVDQSFEAERLRLLSVEEVSAPEVVAMISRSRENFATLSKELGWPEAEIAPPLSLVLIPQSVLCNPRLYEKGGAPENCQEREAWLRPREQTLYLVPRGGEQMQDQLDYWVAMSSCIAGTVVNCTDVLHSRLQE